MSFAVFSMYSNTTSIKSITFLLEKKYFQSHKHDINFDLICPNRHDIRIKHQTQFKLFLYQ